MNKNVLIGLGALLLLVGGGYFFLSAKKEPVPPVLEQSKEETVETASPEQVGLQFTLRPDKKAAKFSLNAKDIASVAYQISYTKEVNGEEVPEALIGEARPKGNDATLGIDYREFGTCSAKVCRYDKVIFPVTLILKITSTSGKILQTESTLSL